MAAAGLLTLWSQTRCPEFVKQEGVVFVCKTCGCAAGNNMQLELHVRIDEKQSGLQNLHSRLMGEPGILHVEVDQSSRVVLIDFSPKRITQQDVSAAVSGYGAEIVSSQVRELEHRHGVTAFLKRMIRQEPRET
jgi:hypothetical protein